MKGFELVSVGYPSYKLSPKSAINLSFNVNLFFSPGESAPSPARPEIVKSAIIGV